jgi:DNA-binding transcriptional ArsR family regulator
MPRSFAYVPSHTTGLPAVDDDDADILEPGEGIDWKNQDSDRLGAINHALTIVRLLADEELDLYELADRTGLGQRSIRRYIYALQLAGLDIIVRRPKRYYTRFTYRLDPRSWHGLLHLPRD